jgi:hypothetical protein
MTLKLILSVLFWTVFGMAAGAAIVMLLAGIERLLEGRFYDELPTVLMLGTGIGTIVGLIVGILSGLEEKEEDGKNRGAAN